LSNFRKQRKCRFAQVWTRFRRRFHSTAWQGFAAGDALPRVAPRFHRTMAKHVVVSDAKTWLGENGWRRAVPISVSKAPASA
jgi:hypothetical protein